MKPEEFRAARDVLGLTQKQLAAALGYGSAQRISDIENGQRQAGAAAARLLLAYLHGYRPDDWPG